MPTEEEDGPTVDCVAKMSKWCGWLKTRHFDLRMADVVQKTNSP